MLSELVGPRFLETHRHVVVLGPVGVGKTFIAQAFGHIACRHGYHVRFTRADEMLQTLKQSRFDNSRDAQMIALTSVDLLLVDDFALEQMTKEKSKDVYQLFLERTGRASMIISSNRDTAEWLAMFDDVLLAQSAVDRFKNAAYDFVIEGESYRPRLKPTLDASNPPPDTPPPKRDCILGRAPPPPLTSHLGPSRVSLGARPPRVAPSSCENFDPGVVRSTNYDPWTPEPFRGTLRPGCSLRFPGPMTPRRGGPMALRTGTQANHPRTACATSVAAVWAS
jgi:hypothetical protein